MINIAIIEDDKKASDNLNMLVNEYMAQRNIQVMTQQFSGGISFLDHYKAECDIAFLDINMPNMDGLEVSRELRKVDSRVIIIFVTDMAQYAIKGYEVDALDFIVKPVKFYELSRALDKAVKLLGDRNDSDIILRHNGLFQRVKISDIIYIEVARHHIIWHTSCGDIEGWGALDNIEKSLPANGFFRLHSAYLISFRYVVRVDGGDVVLKNGVKLRISRTRKVEFMAALAKYFGER